MRILKLSLLFLIFFLLFCTHARGASYRSTNFIVDASTPQLAERIGQWAEYWRKDKAIKWLGREMPNWESPTPLKVTVTLKGGAGGATQFGFDRGKVVSQEMHIEGSVERLLSSVLPHEITHTVFAYYFRRPLPRWADEGGAVFEEDKLERERHDSLCRTCLNTGRAFSLQALFEMREYPQDVMCLYSEGYCVVNFLIDRGGRQRLLSFLDIGMREGWDRACNVYDFKSVSQLEQAWLQHMRDTKGKILLSGIDTPFPVPPNTSSNTVVQPNGVTVTTLPSSSQQGNDSDVMKVLTKLDAKMTVVVDNQKKIADALNLQQKEIDDLKAGLKKVENDLALTQMEQRVRPGPQVIPSPDYLRQNTRPIEPSKVQPSPSPNPNLLPQQPQSWNQPPARIGTQQIFAQPVPWSPSGSFNQACPTGH